MFVLDKMKIKGSIIIAILLWSVVAWLAFPEQAEFKGIASFTIPPIVHWFDFSFASVSTAMGVSVIFTLFFVDFFDTAGTLTSVANVAGKIDSKGKVEDIDKAMLSDSVGTVAGAFLGTTTVTSYVESGTGVKEGGRTGMTSIVIGVLFLSCIFFSDLATSIPKAVDGAALVFIAVLFVKNIVDIEWNDMAEAGPAVLAMIAMPLTFSISNGIAIAFITYALIKICTGKVEGVSPAIWLVAVLSAINLYIYS
jgi:AGZA family xanthine/uracil permease-like MFS transporter